MIREAIRKFLGIQEDDNSVNIPVKYFKPQSAAQPLQYTKDWVDVRACEGVELFHKQSGEWVSCPIKDSANGDEYVELLPNELYKIPLGIAMKLPINFEAIMKVRSSTSKNTGLIMATSGVIDEGYCGPNDQWFAVMYSTSNNRLYLGERIAQFRIQEKQPKINFQTVRQLTGPDRGGHGSTGRH